MTARQFTQLLTAQHGGAARVKPLTRAEFLKLKWRACWHSRPGETQAEFEQRCLDANGAVPDTLWLVDGIFYAKADL
jgi:uncharacterized protein (DUF362 family)